MKLLFQILISDCSLNSFSIEIELDFECWFCILQAFEIQLFPEVFVLIIQSPIEVECFSSLSVCSWRSIEVQRLVLCSWWSCHLWGHCHMWLLVLPERLPADDLGRVAKMAQVIGPLYSHGRPGGKSWLPGSNPLSSSCCGYFWRVN